MSNRLAAGPALPPHPRLWVEVAIGAVLLLASAAWLWLITTAWPHTPDGDFHLQRTRALAEAFGQGVFYPRWFPDFAFGYGHPILHYYAPGSYVPPALLHWAGMDILEATRLALALCFGLANAAAYAAWRLFTTRPAAVGGALLFVAFPYRLYDLLVRGALPEFAAFLWLPLIVAATLWALRSITDNALVAGARPPARFVRLQSATVLAGFSWAGLALTHNLSTLMAALLFVAALPFIAWRVRSWQALLLLCAGPGLGALLSAFYTVPALVEAGWVGIGSTPDAAGYAAHFAGWTDLAQWGLRYLYPAAAQPTVPLPGYVILLALVGVGMALLIPRRRFALTAALAGVALTIWLTSAASSTIWDAAAPVLGKLQFPWRWQTMLAVPLCALFALLLNSLPSRATWAAALVLGAAAWGYAAPPQPEGPPPAITRASMWAFDAAYGQIGATWTGEFLPRWVTAPRWTIGREPETAPAPAQPIQFSADATAQGYWTADYRITAAETTAITLDRFYFPAWQVTLNGVPAETFPSGELGLLGVTVPAGISHLAVTWVATPAVWAGRGLSTLGWLIVLVLLARRRTLAGRAAILAWTLAGALALLGISGWTARSQPLQSVTTGYRALELGGVLIAPVRQHDAVATVDLFWTVRAPLPQLTVFVHVLDQTGRVVAQWDEPLGGPYRPAARLAPGMLLRQTVTVPFDLPPGDYRVNAGLYPSGAPHAPLTPLGTRQTRIAIGALQIRP